MARLVTYKNGVRLWLGRATLAQERQFYRSFGGAPVAWHRGERANLGPSTAAASGGSGPREPSPDPVPSPSRGRAGRPSAKPKAP